LTNIVKVKVCS